MLCDDDSQDQVMMTMMTMTPASVGELDGEPLGAGVGESVGMRVGESVGTRVGWVGSHVGSGVGDAVGPRDGADVGAHCGPCTSAQQRACTPIVGETPLSHQHTCTHPPLRHDLFCWRPAASS